MAVHRKHEFLGEEQAATILPWLNRHGPGVDHMDDPVEKLCVLEARRANQLRGIDDEPDPSGEIVTLVQDTSIRWHLHMTRTVTLVQNDWLVSDLLLVPIPTGDEDVPLPQRQAFMQCLNLKEVGLLARIRRCDRCGLWFLAKFSHSRFHSKECQREAVKENEEMREAKRNYARALRAKLKKSRRTKRGGK